MTTDDKREAAGSDRAGTPAMLTELAACLEAGLPLWHALPQAFCAAGRDPLDAVIRLASREWRLTTLLSDLRPDAALELIRQGEEDATLVVALRAAAALR